LEEKRTKQKRIIGKGRILEGDGRNWKWGKGEEQNVENRP
jgi:hypothetical protein